MIPATQRSAATSASPASAPAAGRTVRQLLSLPQTAIAIAVGLALWFAGTQLVLQGGRRGWLNEDFLWVTYALTIPSGWVSVWLMRWAADLQPAQILAAVTVGSAAATLADGVALSWTRSLYGPTPELVLPGAALILWGAGWVFVAAYLELMRTAK